MKKHNGSITIVLVAIVVLLGVVTYLAYGKYQQNKHEKQAYVAALIAEQEKIVLEQRAELGELPDQVVAQPIQRQPAVQRQIVQPDQASVRQNFSCDGRQHCSQMRSYEEAVFFNQYCPNTKMDGDGDGIPCEKQFNR